ncbi:MAG: META domain-containing protein [Chthoniobacter sp.]|nr:META domain-containing protein [Chthoniobacter sp.]
MSTPRLLLFATAFCAFILPAVAADPTLEGGVWTLTELNGKAFAAPAVGRGVPTLTFDAAKKSTSGISGVNRFSGGYTQDGAKLKFGALAGTKMAGPPEAMQVESSFHAALASVTAWQIADDALALLSEAQVVARFKRGAEPAK